MSAHLNEVCRFQTYIMFFDVMSCIYYYVSKLYTTSIQLYVAPPPWEAAGVAGEIVFISIMSLLSRRSSP